MQRMRVDITSLFSICKAGVLFFLFLEVGIVHADVAINFPDGVELSALIQAVSTWKKDKTILFTPQETKGKITIFSPEKVTEEDGYAAFLASLQQLGYAAIEAGNVIRIEKMEKSRKSNTKVFQAQYPLAEDVITYLYPLKNAEGEIVRRTLAN